MKTKLKSAELKSENPDKKASSKYLVYILKPGNRIKQKAK